MLNSVTVVFAAVLAKYLYRDWPEKNWTHFFDTFLLFEASKKRGLWVVTSLMSKRICDRVCDLSNWLVFEIVEWFELFSTNVRIWSEPEKLIDCHAWNSVSAYICIMYCVCVMLIYIAHVVKVEMYVVVHLSDEFKNRP